MRNRYAREPRRQRNRASPIDVEEELRSPSFSIGELINGRIYKRKWTYDHVETYGTIDGALGETLWARNGWMFDFRPEIHIDHNIVVADFAGWRANRYLQPDRDDPICCYSKHSYTASPDWICDIVDHSNKGFIFRIKMPFYRGIGVSWIWILDSRTNTLEIHRAVQNGWQLVDTFHGTGIVRARPLQHLSVHLEPRDKSL